MWYYYIPFLSSKQSCLFFCSLFFFFFFLFSVSFSFVWGMSLTVRVSELWTVRLRIRRPKDSDVHVIKILKNYHSLLNQPKSLDRDFVDHAHWMNMKRGTPWVWCLLSWFSYFGLQDSRKSKSSIEDEFLFLWSKQMHWCSN